MMTGRVAATCALSCLPALALETTPRAFVLHGGGRALTIDRGDGRASVMPVSPRSDEPPAPARLVIREGVALRETPLGTPRIEADARRVTLRYRRADVTLTVSESQGAICWRVGVGNRRSGMRLVEVALQFDLSFEDEWSFWDGHDVFDSPAKPKARDLLRGTFPATAAFTSDVGHALALAPMQFLSYLRPSATPVAGDKQRLALATRVVVDPGESEVVAFLTYAFPGEYGFLGALERYYALFPEVFRARPDVDQRVTWGGATYLAWTSRPQPELCRRLYAGWEWCYAPFKRTGDILGKPEFWDYEPARPLSGARKYPREQYHKWRRNQFLNGRLCDVAMLFYIPSGIWCEERLAREHYADALVDDPDVKTYFDTPWVTGHDNELRVYPLGNRFGDVTRSDMRAVIEELDLSGFAFDVAQGGAKFRGRGLKASPGRAFDENGVYVDEGVAIADLMDFVHAQKKGGKTLAVVGNPTAAPVFMTVFRTDSSMFEGVPWRRHAARPVYLRYFLGQKTMVWWEDFLLERVVAWERMTPDQIRDAYRGLADYVILASLRLGSIPTPRMSLGVPKIARWLPVIVELTRAGWRAVTAVRTDERIWAARYGDGAGTFIALCNPTAEAVKAEVVVDNRWLGDRDYRFVTYAGEPLDCAIAQRRTSFRVSIAPRDALVLKTTEAAPRRKPWRSSDEEAILSFGFVRDGKPNCVIVVPDNAHPDEQYAAQRLQEYFRYYYSQAEPAAEVVLQIAEASEAPREGPQVLIRGDGGRDQVRLSGDGARLYVRGKTPARARDVLFELLRLL
ncbi:MAG: hypothetical protein ACE5O2_06790, partial [Armatimonadota bacterium]